uniref:Uncharacterized protein n=1 Tax=Rhizophora mucronata TaxID=61149 RepID=A0A2P2NMU2_RHIMU
MKAFTHNLHIFCTRIRWLKMLS